jgi:hypothetical protein
LGLDFTSPFDILSRSRGEDKSGTFADRRGPKVAGKSINLPGSLRQHTDEERQADRDLVSPRIRKPLTRDQYERKKLLRQIRARLVKRKPLTPEQRAHKNAMQRARGWPKRTERAKARRRERDNEKVAGRVVSA